MTDYRLLRQREIVANEKRKRLARKSFLAFNEYVRKDYRAYHHSKIICEELEQWRTGAHPRLALTVPPQYGKSTHSSILLPAFILGVEPDARILLLSYGASLAGEFNREVQKVMDSPEYLELFPNSALNPENVRSMSDKPRRNSDVIDIPNHTGMFVNGGIGGGYTGKGFHYIILDDLIKSREEAESPTYRDGTDAAYTDTIRTRRANDKTRILILNTRWHEDDITGRRIKLAKENPKAEQWRVVNLPVLLSDCENPIEERWKFPPNQEPGKEVLWPEHFSYEDVVQTKESSTAYNFSAQYMGSPTAKAGNAIKRYWYEPFIFNIKFEDVVSATLSYDVNFSDSQDSDWTWGSFKVKLKDGKCVTLWQHFGHWSNDKRRKALAEFGLTVKAIMRDCFPNVRWSMTEEAGVGPGVQVTREDIQYLVSVGLPARAHEIKKQAKPVRAISYLAACETGMTQFYAGAQFEKYGLSNGTERWINPFLNEVTRLVYADNGLEFKGGKDDPLDAEVMAHDELTKPESVALPAPILFY